MKTCAAKIGISILLMLALMGFASASCRPDIALSAPDSRYIVHNDGTVTDQHTGLMWMRCAIGQTWDGSTCTGQSSNMKWSSAESAAADANFAGYDDWSLPTIKQLASLVELACHGPAINDSVFPNTPYEPYWSRSAYGSSGSSAWEVSFSDGRVITYSKAGTAGRVRLVRIGRLPDIGNFPGNERSDTDNDGVDDYRDALPLDPLEQVDTDGDGIGDNADRDDDNDGIFDEDDDSPLNQVPKLLGELNVVSSIAEETQLAGSVQAEDAEGDPLTLIVAQSPSKGRVEFNGLNWVYNPNVDFFGEDTFAIKVFDGNGTSVESVSVTVDVTNVADDPVINIDDTVRGPRGEPVTLDLNVLAYSPDQLDVTRRLSQISGPSVKVTETSEHVYQLTVPDAFVDTEFEVIVSDANTTISHVFVLEPINRSPTAIMEDEYEIDISEEINLDASDSFDPDQVDTLSYEWRIVFGDEHAQLSHTDALLTTFKATELGYYVLELSVSDPHGGTSSKQFFVKVTRSAEPARLNVSDYQLTVDIPNALKSKSALSIASLFSSAPVNMSDGAVTEFASVELGTTFMAFISDQDDELLLAGIFLRDEYADLEGKYPVLGEVLFKKDASSVFDTHNIALGFLMMHPHFAFMQSDEKLEFLGLVSTHPDYERVRDRFDNLIYQQDMAYADAVEDVDILWWRDQIVTGIIESALADYEDAVANAQQTGNLLVLKKRTPLMQYAAMLSAQQRETNSFFGDKNLEVVLEGGGRVYANNPYYAHYLSQVTQTDTGELVTSATLHRRTSFIGVNSFTSILLGESIIAKPYKSTMLYLKPKVAYTLTADKARNYTLLSSSVQFLSIVFDFGSLDEGVIYEAVLEMDFGPAQNLMAALSAGDNEGALLNTVELVRVNWGVFYDVLLNRMIKEVFGSKLSSEAALKFVFKKAGLSASPVGLAATAVQAVNGPLLGVKDAIFAPDRFRCEVYWGETDQSDAIISNCEETKPRPELVLEYDSLEGQVPFTLNIDASNSKDPAGNGLNFEFTLGDPSANAPVANTPRLNYTFQKPGTYQLWVSVNDGTAGDTQTLTIEVGASQGNRAPVANAGIDNTVGLGSAVVLDGTSSFDADGDRMNYRWTQMNGSTIAIKDRLSNYGQFRAPAIDQVMRFRLKVDDGEHEDIDYVDITVGNPDMGQLTLSGKSSVSEGGSTALTVTLDSPRSYDVFVSISANNNEFRLSTTELVIHAGETSGNFVVAGRQDSDSRSETTRFTVAAASFEDASHSVRKNEVNTASIRVTLDGPQGASFTYRGQTYNSSQTFTNVSKGTYTITFNEVSGYVTPRSQTLTVGTSGNYSISGIYFDDSLGEVTVLKSGTITASFIDNGSLEDDDRVKIILNGNVINSSLSLLQAGTNISLNLRSGVNTLIIEALNEGSHPPNTAQIRLDPSDVVDGEPIGEWELNTGEKAGLILHAP